MILFVVVVEILTWTTLRAWTALTAFRTRTATLRTWTTLALGISLRLLKENLARELVFSCLLVNLEELHLNLVALFDTSLFNCFKALPVNL